MIFENKIFCYKPGNLVIFKVFSYILIVQKSKMEVRMKMLKFIKFIILFSVLLVPFSAKAVDEVSYNAEVGTCKKAKNAEDAKDASHLFFEIDEGKKLWAELGQLRLEKKRVRLLDTSLSLKDQVIGLWKLQFEAAEKAVKAQKEVVVQTNLKNQKLEKRVVALEKDVKKWREESIKYKGQRYQFLFWGIAGGITFSAVAVVVVVVVLNSLK